MGFVSDTFVQAGETLFTRRGGWRGSRRAGVRSWVVLMFCSHSLRLIVFHVFSLSSGVFDWLRVCGLWMLWMDMLVDPQISLTLVEFVYGHHVLG